VDGPGTGGDIIAKTMVEEATRSMNIVYFVLAAGFGWFANYEFVRWVIDRTSMWLGITAEMMVYPVVFILAILAFWFIVSKFGSTIKIVVAATFFGLFAHWVTLVIIESEGIDTAGWWWICIDAARDIIGGVVIGF